MKALLSLGFIVLFSVVTSFGGDLYKDLPWYEGVVVMQDDEVINGDIQINQRFNVVLLRDGDEHQSIPADKIHKVTIHDEEMKTLRTFISVIDNNKYIAQSKFYELIVSGQISYISRIKEFQSSSLENFGKFLNKNVNVSDQYVGNHDFYYFDGKNVISDDKFRKKVLPAFKKYFNQEIVQFIKAEQLNLNNAYDQLAIMKYFNELYKSKTALALHR